MTAGCLLLLHGAIGSKTQLDELKFQLEQNLTLHSINFSGHGGEEIPTGDFSIKLFADDVLHWMNENTVATVDVFGYSMGGYVALYLARHHPEKIRKIFTLATKFNWTSQSSEQEVKMLNPGKIIEKLPAFAETLQKRHAPQDWKIILKKTADMMLAMGNDKVLTDPDFAKIEHAVMLSVGDHDKMVGIEETTSVFHQLKKGSMTVFPSTAHAIESANTGMLSYHIRVFMDS